MRPKYCVNSIRSATGQKYFIDDVVDVNGHMFLKVDETGECTYSLIKLKDIGTTADQKYHIGSVSFLSADSDKGMPVRIELLESGMLVAHIMRHTGAVWRRIHLKDIVFSVPVATSLTTLFDVKLYPVVDVLWKDVRRGYMLVRYIMGEVVDDVRVMVLRLYLRGQLFGL